MKVRCNSGFTLVEVFVVVAVILLLTSIVFAVGKGAMEKGAMAKETGAARKLTAAYAAAAADNDGWLLPGIDNGAEGYEMPSGESISGPAAHRYPFRLAPYFDYGLDGVILVNQKAQLKQAGLDGDSYGVSLSPALGMNATFVGGEYDAQGKLEVGDMESDVAQRMGEVSKPSNLLVFASAGRKVGTVDVDGFHRIEPPNVRVAIWGAGDESPGKELDPANYGNVDFRHGGQAVCGFLDGSVRSLTPTQLRDMRLWNRNAQDEDNPGYTVKISTPGGGRGPGRR